MNLTLYELLMLIFLQTSLSVNCGKVLPEIQTLNELFSGGKWKSSSEENIEILIFFQYSNSMIALHIKVMQIWKWAFGLQSCIKTVSKLGDSKTE